MSAIAGCSLAYRSNCAGSPCRRRAMITDMRVLLSWVVSLPILAQRGSGDQVASAHVATAALAPADLALLGEGALGARLEADPAQAAGHATGAAPFRRPAAHPRGAVHHAGAGDGGGP